MKNHLTKRETEVLRLVKQGKTSLEIAEKIETSKRTVDFHLANIYQMLKAHNRIQAINAAEALGLI